MVEERSRRVGRKIEQLGAAALYQWACPVEFVRAEVVQDDDVARLQPWPSTCSRHARKTSPSVGDSLGQRISRAGNPETGQKRACGKPSLFRVHRGLSGGPPWLSW